MSEDNKRKLRHLGLIGPRIPCGGADCKFFSVKLGLCTNCYASARRKRTEVKAMEHANKKRYLAKPEKAEQQRLHRLNRDREWYQSEEYKEKKKLYYTSPEGRAGYAARTALRRALKRQATPHWLTPRHLHIIKRIYQYAGAAGAHVDHIVPLNGENVCGLHVPWNLAILTPTQNLSKGNTLDEEKLRDEWELRKSILES